MIDDKDRVYERFQLIANGPGLFNAVIAGLETDVFGLLHRHPGSDLRRIGEFTGLDEHRLRVLMLGLCATELVTKDGEKYSNHPVAEELLAPDSPASWRHILRSWHQLYYPAFFHLTSALRAGTNAGLAAHEGAEPTLYERLAHDPNLAEVFHTAMAAFTLQTMPALLENGVWETVHRVLDVGGGNGTNARHLARRYPHLHLTVLDLPHVVELARAGLPADLEHRVDLVPADMLQDELPAGADCVLLSHLLDTVSAEQAQALLAKAYDRLPAGGRIVIYGFVADDEENGGVLAARLSLYLNVLAAGRGMAWPAADFERWLSALGCTVTRSGELPYEHGLVIGTKP